MGIAEPEEDFPRGGVPSTGQKTATSKAKTTSKRKNEDALFGDGTKKSKTSQAGVKKSTEEKKKTDKTAAWTKPMTLELLTEGVCGVGVVREINDDHLIMETSDSCRVRLPANQIGKQFTDLLKKEQLSLDEAFRVGQMVPFRVTKRMEKTITKGKKKRSTTLPMVTCDPSKLNSHLVPSQLVSGLVIHSIVETLEEKGYVLDIGLQSAKGFLPLEKAPTEKLLSGQPLVVRIESSTTRVVKVSAFVEQDTLSADACEKLKLNHLMPGTIIECDPVVEDPHAAGVFVIIGNDIRAFVARRHLPPRLRADTSRLVKSFRSVVMFCQQNSNLLVLSAHPDIVAISKPEKRQSFEGLEVGDKIVCSVLDVIPTKFNVTFALPAGADGKASLVTASCSKAYLHKAEECETYYKIGSEHECRVVDFRYAERSVIVATRKDILKQKMISYRDAIPGELIKATVTKPNAAGVNALIFGTIRGFMPLHLISDKAVSIEKTYPIDKEFQCRILNVDPERKQVTLTAKPALLKHSGAKITAYSEDFVGKTAVGIITKVFPTGALLVVFYNNILGVLPAQEAKKLGNKAVKDKSVHVKVTSVDEAASKIQLAVAAEEEEGEETEPLKMEEKVEKSKKKEVEKTKKKAVEKEEKVEEESDGKAPSKRSIKNFNIYTGTLIGQWDNKEAGPFCFKVKLPGDHLGRLHVSELPSKYLTGNDICAGFLKKNLSKKINVKLIGFATLQVDGAEKVRVCELTMAEKKMVQTRVREKMLGYRQKYKKGEVVTCFVSSTKDPMHVRVDLSPIAAGVIPREQLTADMLTNEEERAICSMITAKVNSVTKKKGKLQLSLTPAEAETKETTNEGFEMGQLLTARVLNVNQVNFGVSIQLASGQQAILGPTGVSENYERVQQHLKKFKKGELFRFIALKRDEEPRRYHVITEGRYKQYQKDEESREPTALLTSLEAVMARKGESVQGFLCYNSGPDYSLVEIGPGIRGSVKKNSVVEKLPLNSVLSVKIKDIDEAKKKVYLSFEKVLSNTPEPAEKKEEEPVSLKRKIELSTRILQSAEQGERIQMEDVGFEWDNAGFTPDDLAAVGKIESAPKMDKKDEPPKKKAKKTPIGKERELAARELALTEDQIETDEDFDRLVRNEPSSAAVWIRYMSHFLEKNDLEKARATAERALTVIGYREESELFNLWTAYLNMEVAFGDPETTKTIFERACGNADSLKIHKQMAAIFIANEKIEEADEIFAVMIRKFRASSDDVWYLYADHLMATERPQEGRELLQRALASVPKIRHSQLISRFAQLEYQKGDAERGRTLFESLVTAYPKKTDLWMVYADFSLKYNGIEVARQVLERASSLSLNMHKLRPIYKKWMEFEQKHGDEQSQNLVRAQAQRALQGQEDE